MKIVSYDENFHLNCGYYAIAASSSLTQIIPSQDYLLIFAIISNGMDAYTNFL